MRYIRNSQGYTLLVTFGVIILFTVLGLSLLTLTTNGITKNETRQSKTHTTDLAEKGVNYLQREIEIILKTKLEEDKKDYKLNINNIFDSTFVNNTTSNYFCTTDSTSGVIIPGENGSNTFVCIEKPTSITDVNYVVNETTRSLRLRSIGDVNGKKSTHYYTVEFSFSTVPKQLSYAVSTNKEGDLYFFGGTDIIGDVKVAGDLLVSESSFWRYGNTPIYIRSTYPKLMSPRANGVSNIILNNGSTDTTPVIPAKKVYKITATPSDVDKLLEGATNSEKLKIATEVTTDTDIQNLFLHSESSLVQGLGTFTQSLPLPPNIIKTEPLQDDQIKILENITAISKKGPNEIEKSTNGMRIHTSGKHSVSKTAKYIKGNVNISSTSYSGWGENRKVNPITVNLSGNYYVDGDLYIGYTNLNANAIFYVSGVTHIEHSTIKKLENNGTLFIFSENTITINNISTQSKEEDFSEIDGFFYSNNNFLMYGVGSNVKITGGMSAKNAIFTSLRGNSYDRGDLTNSIPNACKIEYVTSPEQNMFYNDKTLVKEWAERVNRLIDKNQYNKNITNSNPFSYSKIAPEWIEPVQNDYLFLDKVSKNKETYYSGTTTTNTLTEWDYIIKLVENPNLLPFNNIGSSLDLDIEQLTTISNKLDKLLEQWDTTAKNAYTSFYYRTGTSTKSDSYSNNEWKKIKNDLSKLSSHLKLKIEAPISIPNYCWTYYEDARYRSGDRGDPLYQQLNSNSRIKIFYNNDLVDDFLSNRAYEHINISDIDVMPPVVKKIDLN